jgi:hypothetical protein
MEAAGAAGVVSIDHYTLMLPPADPLTVRSTVIAGEKGKDDFVVIWNGISAAF